MSVVTIEIPERFTRSFGETDEEAQRNAKLELAIEMYREGKWSTRKAAEFAFGSMSFARGEVIPQPIPFWDLSSRKVRPAVVIGFGRHSNDLFVVPITSQLRNTEVKLVDWRLAGLNVPCGIKSQIATIEQRLVIKSLGFHLPQDRSALEAEVKSWFGFG